MTTNADLFLLFLLTYFYPGSVSLRLKVVFKGVLTREATAQDRHKQTIQYKHPENTEQYKQLIKNVLTPQRFC